MADLATQYQGKGPLQFPHISYTKHTNFGGRNSVDGTATVHRQTPVGARNFLFSATVQIGPGVHKYSWYQGSLPAVMRLRRGAEHTPPSTADVKKALTLTLCVFMACHRGNSAFHFVLTATTD
jgi:hypothetical protein